MKEMKEIFNYGEPQLKLAKYPHPFTETPPLSVRALVQGSTTNLVSGLLANTHLSVEQLPKAVSLLRVICFLSESRILVIFS